MASLFASHRVRTRALLCVLVSTVLAACSSGGAAPELTTAPAVTANGKHYAYAPGSVDRSAWPKVCSLLTTDSAAAAIGTGVTAHAFHHRCFYSPGNDSFPTLTVTILGIGDDQQGAYDAVRDANAAFRPQRVARLGQDAIVYLLRASPTYTLDLLTDQGLFEVSLRSPVGLKTGRADAHSILTRVGRVLAAEFTS